MTKETEQERRVLLLALEQAETEGERERIRRRIVALFVVAKGLEGSGA